MGRFSREPTLHFAALCSEGQLLKEKNLLLLEQMFPFKSRPYLRKEAMRNLQKFFLRVKTVEGGRFIPYSFGGVYIQLYISEIFASTKY